MIKILHLGTTAIVHEFRFYKAETSYLLYLIKEATDKVAAVFHVTEYHVKL